MERTALQRTLREHVDVVAPDTRVIAEDFSPRDESRRRIDLLAIDKDANLVVIELKRTEEGGHMELQSSPLQGFRVWSGRRKCYRTPPADFRA